MDGMDKQQHTGCHQQPNGKLKQTNRSISIMTTTTDSMRRYINSIVSDARLFTEEERTGYYKQVARLEYMPELQRIADEVKALEQTRWTEYKQSNQIFA
jgi:hypothetical protein